MAHDEQSRGTSGVIIVGRSIVSLVNGRSTNRPDDSMRRFLSFGWGVTLVLGSAAMLHAQEVTWEDIGPTPLPVDAIVLKNGTTPDGSTDTLYVTGSGSVELRRITSDDTWSESLKGRALSPDLVGLTAEGYLLTHANAII
ncbi:MAG: hypothetical protein AAFX41_17940, partial [Bacteroidota bacterium]